MQSRGWSEAEDGTGEDCDAGLSLRVEADWGERSSCNRWLHPSTISTDYSLETLSSGVYSLLCSLVSTLQEERELQIFALTSDPVNFGTWHL